MPQKPSTVAEYLAALPDDRRQAIEAIRKVVRRNLPKGYAEGIQYGVIGYFVPHSVYPAGYHCDPKQPLPLLSIASQKNHMAVYLCSLYMNPMDDAWFRKAWTTAGKKLDMGKGCVRFKKLEDVPLDVLGAVVARVPVNKFIKTYESRLGERTATKSNMPKTSKSTPVGGSRRKPAASRRKAATTTRLAGVSKRKSAGTRRRAS